MPKQVQPVAKTLNRAEGFQCPVCKQGMVRLSLDQFLDSNRVVCPVCSTPFTMNKAECAQLVDMLQKMRIAQRNVEMISGKRS